MKNKIAILAASFICLNVTQAAELAGWDIPTGTNPTGSTVSFMRAAAGVTASSITLGSGLATNSSTSSSRWNLTSFGDTPSGQSATIANASNNFIAFNLTANTGYNLKISGVGSLQFGSSGTGPQAWSLLYSSNSTFSSFTVITNAGNTGSTYISSASGGTYNYGTNFNDALSNNPINVPEGSTAYFRIVGWNTFNTNSGSVTNSGSGTGGMVGNLKIGRAHV